MSAVSAASSPDRLPVPLTPLVGRERVVTALCDLLHGADVRLLTLTGTGGTGKTRLAIAVAEQVGDAFRDGVAFVSLAPVGDPALVVSAIAQVLGVRESGERSLQDSLTIYLQSKNMLLILDNFEHVLPAAPLVSDLLAACSALSVMTTSRSPLHMYGEHDYLVPPLALPDLNQLPPFEQLHEVEAIGLFVARAQAARTGFALTPENAPAIAAICARLDGLPLAIELAAARIRILSPQALLARLEHRLQVLTGGPRDVPERQQTMRNTIVWSYELLTPGQQALLRHLAVFVVGWTLEAAEAVAPSPSTRSGQTDGVIDELAALVDHSLIRRVEQPDGTTRFAMLETIREFSNEQLDASGEVEEVRRRHAAYCVNLVERDAADLLRRVAQGPALARRLDGEHDNIRAALGWLLQHDPNTALCVASHLWPYWAIRGLKSEGVRWLTAALERSSTAPARHRAGVLLGLGTLASDLGDLGLAQNAFDESLPLSERSGDRFGVAWALRRIGVIAGQRGDVDQAFERYSASLVIARELNESWLTIPVLGNLATVASEQGDLDRAATLLEEAVAIARETGNVTALSMQLHNLAVVKLDQGDVERAKELCTESITRGVEIAAPGLTATALDVLAEIVAAGGTPNRAAQLYAAAEAALARIGETAGLTLPDRVRRLLQLRDVIGEPEWERAWAAGQAMSLDEAVAFALEASPAPGQAISNGAETSLTPRELQVLRLIADGKADKEIAAILSISPHTVMRHVHSILVKLGLPSRTAVATYAVRHGLV